MREYTIVVNEAELNIIGTGVERFSAATVESINNLIGKLRLQAREQEKTWAAQSQADAAQGQLNLQPKESQPAETSNPA